MIDLQSSPSSIGDEAGTVSRSVGGGCCRHLLWSEEAAARAAARSARRALAPARMPPAAASSSTWRRISRTRRWELECSSGEKVGLLMGRYSGKSRPDLNRTPHALHSVLGPAGPCRHCGVSSDPHASRRPSPADGRDGAASATTSAAMVSTEGNASIFESHSNSSSSSGPWPPPTAANSNPCKNHPQEREKKFSAHIANATSAAAIGETRQLPRGQRRHSSWRPRRRRARQAPPPPPGSRLPLRPPPWSPPPSRHRDKEMEFFIRLLEHF
uniref:Uncharacterized protein n=1 Tax=Setaria italica TaxID=4555 RepID=K4ADR8_SETIT